MNYRDFGQDKVSILGFGCMRFPMDSEGNILSEQSKEMLLSAFRNGVNYYDTAYVYHKGASEGFLGDFIAENNIRDRIFIATKLPCWLIKQPEDMERLLDEQLTRQKTDYIDYYMLHGIHREIWQKMYDMKVIQFLEAMKAKGKIRRIGFSFHDSFKVFRQIVNSYNWDFCQIQLNFYDVAYQAGLRGMRLARSKGLGIIVMEPLRGGRLAKQLPDDIQKILDRSGLGSTNPARALNWIWSHPEVSTVLSGMSSLSQVNENAALASEYIPGMLTTREEYIFARARRALRKRMMTNCTECMYCLPCPNQVLIPHAFEFYNNANIFNDRDTVKLEYRMFIPDQHRADKCIACGQCMPKCPQKIDIITELAIVNKYFED